MTRFLAVLAGGMLVAAVTLMLPWAGVLALGLVAASWWWRPAAVMAVLLTIGVLVWADTGVLAAAATGLVATAYLLNAAAVSAPAGVVPTTLPSVLGAVVFAGCAAGAALVPVNIAWAPALVPVVVILLYALMVQGITPRRAPVQEGPPAPP